MKFEINFDNMPDYVLIRTDGRVSVSDAEDMFTKLIDSPKWVPGTSQLVDHRKMITDHVTQDDMRRMRDTVKKYSEKLGHGRCAFVVKDELGYGLARMFELIGGNSIHPDIRVFYSIDEAVEWLKQ